MKEILSDSVYPYRQNSLFNAVSLRKHEDIKSLLTLSKVNINEQRVCDGYTLLHIAITNNDSITVKLLLEHGADPRTTSKVNGYNAFTLTKILPGRDSLIKSYLDDINNYQKIDSDGVLTIPKSSTSQDIRKMLYNNEENSDSLGVIGISEETDG